MLVKTKKDQSASGCGKKTMQFLSKVTRRSQSSPYTRMDQDGKKLKKSKKSKDDIKAEDSSKDKENNNTFANNEVKEKTKRKGWKRFRHAALMTCRYIGMGAAHISPVWSYSSPDYYIDPKDWNKSFNPAYKPKVPPQTPHWTSTMMFAGW